MPAQLFDDLVGVVVLPVVVCGVTVLMGGASSEDWVDFLLRRGGGG